MSDTSANQVSGPAPSNEPASDFPNVTQDPTPQDHVVAALTGLLSKFRDDVILPLVDRIDQLEQRVAASPVIENVEQAVDVAETIEKSGGEIIDAMSKASPPPASV